MKLPKQIKDGIKDTVGYRESDNKQEFMKGADVAYSRAENFYEKEVDSLKNGLKYANEQLTSVTNDFKTLSSLINKYSDHD